MTCSDLARYDPLSIRLRVAAAKGAAVRINITDSCERRTSEPKTERASDRTKRSTMIERFCGAMAKKRRGLWERLSSGGGFWLVQ